MDEATIKRHLKNYIENAPFVTTAGTQVFNKYLVLKKRLSGKVTPFQIASLSVVY
ncbi:hypothetical protein MHB42_14365 [Lysinibacillus sp. FSL K6-0232]|uniref:hypothetical protein n=1 Tax=Lysinibacillus sp. FSL K6-0232 TaxID=2921425 RepID=UPI0030F952BC